MSGYYIRESGSYSTIIAIKYQETLADPLSPPIALPIVGQGQGVSEEIEGVCM